MISRMLLAGATLAALPACSAEAPVAPPPIPRPLVDVEVPWDDYDHVLRAQIDKALLDQNCTSLQRQFAVARDSNQATKRWTNHDNSQLLAYIDRTMDLVGCRS